MFCGKCGKKLPDDALFCSYCGNKTIVDTDVSSQSGQDNTVSEESTVGSCQEAQNLQEQQDTYNNSMNSFADQQNAPQPYNAPDKKSKKKIVLPIVISAAALVVIAIVVILVVFVFNSNKNSDEHPSDTSSADTSETSDTTTTTAEETSETENTDTPDDGDDDDGDSSELIDNVPAKSGHYTTKDLCEYIGRSEEEITDEFGKTMDTSLTMQVNMTINYDDLCFTLITDKGVSMVEADADIVEYHGETLDKSYEDIIALLGLPKNELFDYEPGGSVSGHVMKYVMNENAYVSISFGDKKRAEKISVSLYHKDLPFEIDYLIDLFETKKNASDLFGIPLYSYFDSMTYSNHCSYNVFSVDISAQDGSAMSMGIDADSVAYNGETLDKTQSEIINILGAPDNKGDYSEDDYKYYMQYILDDKWDLFILFNDANSNANRILFSPYQEEGAEYVNASYETRDSYSSTLTLDDNGGFVMGINWTSYYGNISGTYSVTKTGYKFEVIVGRDAIQSFEMRWLGNALVYYGNNVGTTFNGITTYYPKRKAEEVLYNGEPAVNSLESCYFEGEGDLLYGFFLPEELSVDGQILELTADDLINVLGSPYKTVYKDDTPNSPYDVYYYLESATEYRTYEFKFTYLNLSPLYKTVAECIQIKELYIP